MKKRKITAFIVFLFSVFYIYNCFADNRKINEASTNTPEYFKELGDSYKKQGKNIEALEVYKKALALDSAMVSAHIGAGSIYARLKEYDKATNEFELAVKINRDESIEAIEKLIFLYLLKEDVKAIDYLKVLQAMRPQYVAEIYRQVFLSRFYGIEETEDGLTITIPLCELELSDDKFSQYVQRADSYLEKGEYGKAILVYKEFVDEETFPKKQIAAACYTIGTLYTKLNNRSEGIKYIKRAIDLYPDEIFFKMGLIDAYRSTMNYSRGLQEIEKLLEVNPNDKFALFYGGVLYFESQKWDKAIESWDKLKQVDKILFALTENEYDKAKQMCMSLPQEEDSLIPTAATSKYFITGMAGFMLNMEEEPRAYYTLSLEIRKPFSKGAFLEVHFENPQDRTQPIIVTKKINPQDKLVVIESSNIKGLKKDHNYELVAYVYKDETKKEFLGKHRQLIRSAFNF